MKDVRPRKWRDRLAANQRWLRDWLQSFGVEDPDAALWPESAPTVVRLVEKVCRREPVHERDLVTVEAWFFSAREAMRRVLQAERVPPALADDVLQEALTRALEALPRFQDDERPKTERDLRRWMLAILRNVLREHRRRGGRELPTADVAEGLSSCADPSAGALLAQLSPTLFDALEGLPDPQRGAWIAVDLEDADIGRLASLTRTPYQTVCSHLKLARRKLCDALRPLC